MINILTQCLFTSLLCKVTLGCAESHKTELLVQLQQVFYTQNAHLVTQPTAADHHREITALTPAWENHPRASMILEPPNDS